MNELIGKKKIEVDLHKQLLATASALALTAYVASAECAQANDTDRPTVWVEIGGQVEQTQGTSGQFSAPFMTALTPTPDVYGNDIFIKNQRPARLGFGAEGSLSFQPENSKWLFSASLRFGRSQTNRHVHQQGEEVKGHSTYSDREFPLHAAPFADEKGSFDESHTILDFTAGREVGLGVFGDAMSYVNAGIRLAQFSSKSNVSAMGRGKIEFFPSLGRGGEISFYNYTMIAQAERSFHGIGPSLSWNASAPLLGNKDNGELTLDWGINGALLFGRQKAKVTHTTQAYHLPTAYYFWYAVNYYTRAYQHPHATVRSRSVTVPNVGGFVGISVKYPNVKFSAGYRADFFFGATDAGIDTRQTKTLGFRGPFATISIGLP
jgi:hypothetical protein